MTTENESSTQEASSLHSLVGRDWQDRVDEIMDHFDFAAVRRVMEFLDWRWHKDQAKEIPTEAELRTSARARLWEAVGLGDSGFCKSGGFAARRYGEMIELAFEIESYDAGDVEGEDGEAPNDPSSATRLAGRHDCNRDAHAGFAAAHG